MHNESYRMTSAILVKGEAPSVRGRTSAHVNLVILADIFISVHTLCFCPRLILPVNLEDLAACYSG